MKGQYMTLSKICVFFFVNQKSKKAIMAGSKFNIGSYEKNVLYN